MRSHVRGEIQMKTAKPHQVLDPDQECEATGADWIHFGRAKPQERLDSPVACVVKVSC